MTTPHTCLGIHGFGNMPFMYGGDQGAGWVPMIATDVQPLRPPSGCPRSSLGLPRPLPDAGQREPHPSRGWGPPSALEAPSQDGTAGRAHAPSARSCNVRAEETGAGSPHLGHSGGLKGDSCWSGGRGRLTSQTLGDRSRHLEATGSHTGDSDTPGLPWGEHGGRLEATVLAPGAQEGSFQGRARKGDVTEASAGAGAGGGLLRREVRRGIRGPSLAPRGP